MSGEIEALQQRIQYLESLLPTFDDLKEEYAALRLDQSELVAFTRDITAKCDENGIWQQPISGSRGAYPTILRRCSVGKKDFEEKKRKSNAVMFTCSHIILIAGQQFPFNYGVHASHLCHNTKCCKLEHLRWELRHANEARNRCVGKQECICGQQPSCIPTVHDS